MNFRDPQNNMVNVHFRRVEGDFRVHFEKPIGIFKRHMNCEI